MQGVLAFVGIERRCLGTESSGREGIVTVSGAQAGMLKPAAIREVGGRQQSDGLLPVTGNRSLLEIVDVDWRRPFEQGAIRTEGRVVIIDTGQNGRRHSEDHVLDAQSGRDRPCLQMAVDIVEGDRRQQAEEPRLLFLVAHAAIDDQVDAVHQGLGEAGSGVGALLVAIVEWGIGATAIGDELVQADRRINRTAARKTQLLVVAGQRQERGEAGRGVVQIADAIALVERVVDPIAVGLDAVAVERRRPRPIIGRGRNRCLPLVERSDAGFGADCDRRAADAVLQDDVDDAADRIVAVQHRAAVAARDFNALDRIARNGREIHALDVDVIDPASIDEEQGIGGGERAKTTEVDGGLRAIDAAKQAGQLHARRLCDDFLHGVGRRTRDILRCYDRGRCADDAVELPDSAYAASENESPPGRAPEQRWGRASTMCEARRGVRSSLVGGGLGPGPVLVAGWIDLDRRQLILRCGLLRVAAETPSKRAGKRAGIRKVEANRRARRRCMAVAGVEDIVGGLGMTSVARHSEPSLTIPLARIQ